MIHVIATLEIAPGRRDSVLEHFRRLVPEVEREVGCLAYGPAIDCDSGFTRQAPLRANTVTVVERWESLAHLEAHLQAPHMQAFRQAVGEAIVASTLHILEPA